MNPPYNGNVPDDPSAKRIGPAPKHPSGYAPSDDAPAHVAPPLDLDAGPNEDHDTVDDPPSKIPTPVRDMPAIAAEVAFGLPVPVEERASKRPPAVDDRPPMTLDYSQPRSSVRPPQPSETTWEVTAEPPSVDADREAILRDLLAIGTIDESADRAVERDVTLRATLARARALRFRLMLSDVWPASAWPQGKPATRERPLQLDLAIEAALLAALADGAPLSAPKVETGYPLPFVRTMVDFLRALRPDLPRTNLRDRGSAAIARLTIQGWRSAVEGFTRSARSSPEGARRTCLELAARVALTPSSARSTGDVVNEHRFGALADLERALALPTGSMAQALDEARQPL
jgi:hypothetical protein